MSTRTWIIGLIIIVIIAGVLIIPQALKAPTDNGGSTQVEWSNPYPDMIVVDSPAPGAAITSPLTITGKARGGWYFEASFPVTLTDWDGRIIAQAPAQAQGEWMTSEFVPFSVTLTFDTPTAGDPKVNRGTLILHNDNPSGLPENDKAIELPVVFK